MIYVDSTQFDTSAEDYAVQNESKVEYRKSAVDYHDKVCPKS